jgi:hypothetical protein
VEVRPKLEDEKFIRKVFWTMRSFVNSTPGLISVAGTSGNNATDFKGVDPMSKEEIIELQEMRVSPIPSIRNRFGISRLAIGFDARA